MVLESVGHTSESNIKFSPIYTYPMTVVLTIERTTDDVTLYNTTDTVTPTALQPYEKGTFAIKFTSDDLAGDTAGDWKAHIRLVRSG